MSDAWVVGGARPLAAAAAKEVAELGLRPLRVDVEGPGRPLSSNAPTSRDPVVALVLEDPRTVAELRAAPELAEIPTILIVADGALTPEVADADADELLVRPYGRAELKARIKRARGLGGGAPAVGETIEISDLRIDLATYEVTVGGTAVAFTFMEYELLRFLVNHPGRVFTRESLLSRVWGYDYFGGARTVDVHIRRVRAKLGPVLAERIVTVRSVGYRFDAPDTVPAAVAELGPRRAARGGIASRRRGAA